MSFTVGSSKKANECSNKLNKHKYDHCQKKGKQVTECRTKNFMLRDLGWLYSPPLPPKKARPIYKRYRKDYGIMKKINDVVY